MFDTAYVVLDSSARPILILPDALPAGDTFLHVYDSHIEIGVNGTVHGRIEEMEEDTILLLSFQNKIGMATFDEDGKAMPDEIQYVADVTDKRQ